MGDQEDYQDYLEYQKFMKMKMSAPQIEAQNQEPVEDVSLARKLYRGTAKAMPVAGAAIGGLLGAPAGGVGAIPGAAAGGVVGTGVKQVMEGIDEQGLEYFRPRLRGEQTLQAGKEQVLGGVSGATQEMGGQLIGKGLEAFGKTGLNESVRRGRDIGEAARRLDIEPTLGMTSTSVTQRGLESSLEQSPSIAGSKVRAKTGKVKQGLLKATDDVLDDAGTLTPYQAGEEVKGGLIAKIGEKYDPISASYDDMAQYTKSMEVSERGPKAVARNIRNLPEVQMAPGSSWAGKADQYASWVENAKTPDQLKTLRTLVRKDMESLPYNSPERTVLSEVYDRITGLQNREIMRSSINAARTAGEGKNLGLETVQQMKDTNKAYAEFMKSIKGFSKDAGLGNVNTVDQFISKIESMPSERVAEKLFNTKDTRLLQSMKSEFPDQFEVLRQTRISQITSNSRGPDGAISPQRFITQIKKVSPEARELMFGERVSKIADIEKVVQSLPPKMGPSGTPQGELFNQSWNPAMQGTELARYGLYKNMGKIKGLVNSASEFGASPNASQILGVPMGGLIQPRSAPVQTPIVPDNYQLPTPIMTEKDQLKRKPSSAK